MNFATAMRIAIDHRMEEQGQNLNDTRLREITFHSLMKELIDDRVISGYSYDNVTGDLVLNFYTSHLH